MASGTTRILVVANRTAATPGLLEEVRRRGQEGCTFKLLVPNVPVGQDAESTLALALPLLQEAAGSPVEGLVKGPDPLEAIRETLAEGRLRRGHHLDAPAGEVGVAQARSPP